MICDNCKKYFESGNTNGMPNGIALVLKVGKKITICQKCLIDVGKMSEEEKKTFFDELKGKEN